MRSLEDLTFWPGLMMATLLIIIIGAFAVLGASFVGWREREAVRRSLATSAQTSELHYIRTERIRTSDLDLDGHVVLETKSGQCYLVVTREGGVGISPLPSNACRP